MRPIAEMIPGPLIRLGRTLAERRTRVETIELDDYIAQVLAGEGQPQGGRCGAAGARDHRAHVRAGQSQSPSQRRLRSLRHHALPGRAGRRRRSRGAPPSRRAGACCCTRGSRRSSSIPRGAAASPSWRRRSGPGAIDYSYEPALHDDACEDEPAWASEVRVGEIERALRAAGLRGSRLRNLRVLSRNTSDRVARIARRGLHAVRDERPRIPHGGRPRRRMAIDQEHGVRRRSHRAPAIDSRAAASATASACA